jgi:(p)ppGpp synthase/HD superfamily hydrolase
MCYFKQEKDKSVLEEKLATATSQLSTLQKRLEREHQMNEARDAELKQTLEKVGGGGIRSESELKSLLEEQLEERERENKRRQEQKEKEEKEREKAKKIDAKKEVDVVTNMKVHLDLVVLMLKQHTYLPEKYCVKIGCYSSNEFYRI